VTVVPRLVGRVIGREDVSECRRVGLDIGGGEAAREGG